MKAIIRSGEPVRVFLQPDPAQGVLGMISGGIALDLVDVVTNGSGQWAKLIVTVGSAQVFGQSAQDTIYSYIAAEDFVDALQQPAAKPIKVGFSVIYNAEAAMYAGNLGCRFFCIVGNPTLGSQVKDTFPDAVVMVRPYLDVHALPDFNYIMNQLEGAKDSRLIYTGVNEYEQIGGDPESIRKRAQFDIMMANHIKSTSGATFAAGSFSMGCPDFTNPAVCEAIQKYYAPAYNDGTLWWDHHLYSPNMQHIHRDDEQVQTWANRRQVVIEYEWYESRWRFLFTRCGFDPNSSSRIVCSETGVDEGGVGGFKSHHATTDEVIRWCKRFMSISAQPLNIAGTLYPSPFVGGAIFQVGDPVKWSGYDMSSFEQSMGPDVWGKPLTTILNVDKAIEYGQMVDLAQNVMMLSRDINKRATTMRSTS